MYNLTSFGFTQMMASRSTLRGLFNDEPRTVAEGAERIVQFLYQQFKDDEGNPACALVRLFKTHRYDELDRELRGFARQIAPNADAISGLRCLVLMATAGDRPEWNSRHQSKGHKCIPLTSEAMVKEAPMISQLIEQLGVPIATVLRPNPGLLLDLKDTANAVFYVPEALGSPFIVAQEEFVARYKIRSVVGFGGLVASGDLFAAIMFSKVAISREVADLFKIIGLNMKLAVLPIARKPLF